MTKHLAAGPVEEVFSKLGVRRCTLVVASLTTTVGANHFDGRTDHAAMGLAVEVMQLVVESVVLVLVLVVLAAAGHTAVGVGAVVTPPVESARGLCFRAGASFRMPSRSNRSVQLDEG